MPSILDAYKDTELVIGLVGATGTNLNAVIKILKEALSHTSYSSQEIKVSDEVIPTLIPSVQDRDDFKNDDYLRISAFMDAGNEARKRFGNGALAHGVAVKINNIRPYETIVDETCLTCKQPLPLDKHKSRNEPNYNKRSAYIINSLKHPEEITALREIYSGGFYVIGVYSDEDRRKQCLTDRGISSENAEILMERDKEEEDDFGQHNRDAFQLSDFFIYLNEDIDKLRNSIWRIVDIMFGDHFKTPTFDEYAMFMAFSASLRSADLSRQVGAVVARNEEILATGANDCPKHGGGLYWPIYNKSTKDYEDIKDGRDYTRNKPGDSNKYEQIAIINDIAEIITQEYNKAKKLYEKEHSGELILNLEDLIPPDSLIESLNKSKITDLTEYGRIVHAEMEALLSCARNNINTREATLYCTTFPCHNCAKHIVAAGIERVVYVEPYPKSQALKLHNDSIIESLEENKHKVTFEPFIGVGPRRFFDLFSLKLGSGYPLKRKDKKTGDKIDWERENARLRIQMFPVSYTDLEETVGSKLLETQLKKEKEVQHG